MRPWVHNNLANGEMLQRARQHTALLFFFKLFEKKVAFIFISNRERVRYEWSGCNTLALYRKKKPLVLNVPSVKHEDTILLTR